MSVPAESSTPVLIKEVEPQNESAQSSSALNATMDEKSNSVKTNEVASPNNDTAQNDQSSQLYETGLQSEARKAIAQAYKSHATTPANRNEI